ncbi:MAG: pyridoxal-phosphate dependent enzyme [Candidatus Latescibacteria bacterium]|nr:pyridoxal-phosphate dependent enzyme [Candidatus Latescibacterota bacterium]
MKEYSTFVTHLECSYTGKVYPADQLHGLSEAGKPLLVRYDLEGLGKAVSKEDLQSRLPEFWRYREFLPVRKSENVVRLGELMTPILPATKLQQELACGEILIKDEGRLPTGSFKARGLALAVAMAKAGAQVGLMDADIYGPNVPIMMGLKQQPETQDGKIIPLEQHGVKFISLGLIAGDGVPVIWRGPMLAKMVTQFLQDVMWAPLDCLVIDLPPGTGDVQLTLTQTAPIDGAVIVTTPPKVALEDVRRGVEMFRTVNVPVLGVIENMSSYACAKCGTETSVFGHGGGKHTADLYEVPFLGEIPLHPSLQMGSDTGVPLVASEPESPIAVRYQEIAEQILGSLTPS